MFLSLVYSTTRITNLFVLAVLGDARARILTWSSISARRAAVPGVHPPASAIRSSR